MLEFAPAGLGTLTSELRRSYHPHSRRLRFVLAPSCGARAPSCLNVLLLDSELWTRNSGFGTSDSELQTWNSGLGTLDSELRTRNSGLGVLSRKAPHRSVVIAQEPVLARSGPGALFGAFRPGWPDSELQTRNSELQTRNSGKGPWRNPMPQWFGFTVY